MQRLFADIAHGLSVSAELESLGALAAAQHSDKAPHGMVVHWRILSGAPDEAHDRKSALRIDMQRVLLVVLCIGLSEGIRQPVIMRDQRLQQPMSVAAQSCFIVAAVYQARQRLHEFFEANGAFHQCNSSRTSNKRR